MGVKIIMRQLKATPLLPRIGDRPMSILFASFVILAIEVCCSSRPCGFVGVEAFSTPGRNQLTDGRRPFLSATKSRDDDPPSIGDIEGETTEHTRGIAEVGTRRHAIGRFLSGTAAVGLLSEFAQPAKAISNDADGKKQTNLSDEDILKIVLDQDLLSNQFLVTGQLTRSVYDESCTFQDEIDTYTLDKWIKGTSALFDGNRSKVLFVPGSAKAIGSTLQFRFVEYLCFQIPIAKPIVYLSGTLFLERSPETGLITSYREKWDQDVNTVLTRNSKLFTDGISKAVLDADLDAFFDKNANAI